MPVHPICHKAIHLHFTNAELARMGEDQDAIRAHPEIAKFVNWVSSKPPDQNALSPGRRVKVRRLGFYPVHKFGNFRMRTDCILILTNAGKLGIGEVEMDSLVTNRMDRHGSATFF